MLAMTVTNMSSLLPHHAGDVGGFLGLLLGASFLTICEFVDLFLYNGIKKTLVISQET